jgi:dTMP kinase
MSAHTDIVTKTATTAVTFSGTIVRPLDLTTITPSSYEKMIQTVVAPHGVFILFEGLDRSGKSTHCRLLNEYLQKAQINCKELHFPQRETVTGKIINTYLKDSSTKVDDRVIHMLFSANRWEAEAEMRRDLTTDTCNYVVDRYVYSGFAYSAAKGLDPKWCFIHDHELVAPDIVFYLDNDSREQKTGFGEERYETTIFQEKVKEQFQKLKSIFYPIDTNRPIETVAAEIAFISKIVLATARFRDIIDFDGLSSDHLDHNNEIFNIINKIREMRDYIKNYYEKEEPEEHQKLLDYIDTMFDYCAYTLATFKPTKLFTMTEAAGLLLSSYTCLMHEKDGVISDIIETVDCAEYIITLENSYNRLLFKHIGNVLSLYNDTVQTNENAMKKERIQFLQNQTTKLKQSEFKSVFLTNKIDAVVKLTQQVALL